MSIINGVSAIAGIGSNLTSAATTKASGDINAQIAQQGAEDATLRQVGMNNKKEALNYLKIPSGVGASASSEAARTAMAG